MLKVLIQESDVMFRSGMKYFLSDLFYQRFNLRVGFMIDYTSENIYEADVIVISMCQERVIHASRSYVLGVKALLSGYLMEMIFTNIRHHVFLI